MVQSESRLCDIIVASSSVLTRRLCFTSFVTFWSVILHEHAVDGEFQLSDQTMASKSRTSVVSQAKWADPKTAAGVSTLQYSPSPPVFFSLSCFGRPH